MYGLFFKLLVTKTDYKLNLFNNISIKGILMSIVSVIVLYLVLDKLLDPFFQRLFPSSNESYQNTIQAITTAPIINLIDFCILAPIIEEVLMRGFLLDGLSITYGKIIALLISSILFSILHFNMVQIASSFVGGIILGLLFINTGSLFSCILTHMGYNLLSYLILVLPLINK